MQALEQQLQQRFPHWFSGHRRRIAAPMLRTLARLSNFDAINDFLCDNAHLRGFDFVAAGMRKLGIEYSTDAKALSRIPPTGGLLIVANHPCGALDALALLDLVGKVRRDVRFLANEMLTLIEPLSGLLLPVRVFGGRARPESLRQVDEALERGQCVIVFPAGEVSRLGARGVRDTRWRRGFMRFARRSGAPVLPIHVGARNSTLFYGISALCRPASTMLLAREMFAHRQRPVRLEIGTPITLARDEDDRSALRRIRKILYALPRQARSEPRPPQPLAEPLAPRLLASAMAATECLGRTADGKQIRLARNIAGTPLLAEIGRLRELTFRRVGEGTGQGRDIDAYDAHYEHILVWDADAACIAGAYRVARGAEALARAGLAGLYTATLFRYADAAVPRLAQGLELGRSFVVPHYWGSRSLDYLWQGIGAYLACYPGVRYLFGAVSISASVPRPASEQIVAYYQRYFGCSEVLAEARRPFAFADGMPAFGELDSQAAFAALKAAVSRLGASVPMLYKQYTDLCEPGGAQFLCFSVDPDFSDSIDGLIEVDLERIRPRKRQRYLERNAGASA